MNIYNYPNSLIGLLSVEQKKIFLKLLNKENQPNFDLLKELNKLISSFGGIFSKEKSYQSILEEICKNKRINTNNSNSIFEIEEFILNNNYNTIYNSLNEKDKERFDEEVKKLAIERGLSAEQAKSISAIGTLTGANLAGFGLYIMASTVVGGITSAIGLTLPFAFYTGMSSILSIITGPVGWIAGLGYLAYTFRNDNFETIQAKFIKTGKGIKNVFTGNVEHCEMIVSLICSFRILLQQEFENEISKNQYLISELDSKLPSLKSRKEKINQEIILLNQSLNQIKLDIENIENSKIHCQNNISNIKKKLNSLKKQN